ncbi:MAG: HAD family hydrolase [Flavobacterium sp.]|nr:MAG: HAD family hydrolase [Flavobacterium sp.]
MNLDDIKVIAFDADDTLWVNEPYFRKAEQDFCDLLKDFIPAAACNKILFEIEMQNLPTYGYGIKPFALSLIETAIKISENKIPIETISKLIDIAKEMLNMPIELIEGIEETLQQLSKKYKLVMATKGDLLDQERKLIKSGLEKYFHHIEVMSDKKPKHYQKLIKHLDSKPEEFLMIGNSLKSDILPVLEIGASAIYIPFHTTWEHEKVANEVVHTKFKELKEASELINIL